MAPRREAIIDFIAERFGPDPEDIRVRLAAIHLRDEFKRLATAAASAVALHAFRSKLEDSPRASG